MQIYISIGSLAVAVTAMLLTLMYNRKNTKAKKFELTDSAHERVLSWFNDTLETLILFRLKLESGETYKKSELAHLSALIERGRYFFPNIDRKDHNSEEKPQAFRGYRQAILDILVFSYNILIKDDAGEHVDRLLKLQKLYTSWTLGILNPEKHNKLVGELTEVELATNMTFEEFLSADVQKFYKDYADFREIFWQHKDV